MEYLLQKCYNRFSNILFIFLFLLLLFNLKYISKYTILLICLYSLFNILYYILIYYSYNKNKPNNKKYYFINKYNLITIVFIFLIFFFQIVLENESYCVDLGNNSFTLNHRYLFADKVLNPEMIVLYLLLLLSISIQLYVNNKNTPILCENEFYTNYGKNIPFSEIKQIIEARDVTRVNLTINSKDNTNYNFTINSNQYPEIKNYLTNHNIKILVKK